MTVTEQLLDALKYALPYLEACVPNPRDGVNPDCSPDVNCVDRAKTAIARAESETGWSPWETEKPINQEILVYRPDALVFTAWFFIPEDGDGEGLWFSANGEDLTGDLPTHWMPLPSPPAKDV